MIELREHKRGVAIPVYAQPGAKRNSVLGEHAGMLKVAVTQPPEDGKANAAIALLLAQHLGTNKSNVTQIAGKTNRRKQFLVQEITIEELRELLEN
jgi:uncharacterized protein